MGKKKKNRKINTQKSSAPEKAIKTIALREGVTVEHVRKQMQIAMLNGLCNNDSEVKAFWDSIPREKAVPTPEELIMYISDIVKHKRNI